MAIWDRKKVTEERSEELSRTHRIVQFGKKVYNKVVCPFTGGKPKE